MSTVPIRLTLNATGVKQGERDVTAAFNRIKTGARETATAVDRMGRQSLNPMTRMGQAVDSVGGKSKNLGLVINNMSNQIGDFAVQVSMGTSAIRALGMQAPQAAGALAMLGGPFTAIATGIGLVAALGLPLIGLLLNMGGEAETTADRVGALSEAVDGLSATARLAKSPIQQLYDEYGVMAEKVREAAAATAEFDAYNAAATARNLATQLNAGAFTIPGQFDFIEAMVPTLDALKEANREMSTLEQRDLASLIHNFDITGQEALGVYDALQAVNDAATDEELATAYLGLSTALAKVRPDTEETAAKIGEWQKNAYNAGTELSRVLEFIRQIKENGTITIDVAYSQTLGQSFPENPNWMAGLTPEQLLPPSRPTARRGGGGKSAIEKERDELKRFAEGIKPVLTLLQEYEQNMTKLNRAKEIGAITSEQFAQKEAILTQQFQVASGAMVDYTSVANTFANSLEQGLMSMVDGTMSVQDAFKSMATAVIKELYRVMVVQRLVNSVMGIFGYERGASGDFVKMPTFEGGGETGAGPRSGGLDGRGGFLAMLHPNETVIDHTKGQSGGGGAVTVNQTINVSAGVAQTVRAEMQNMLPAFRQQATQGVLDAKRRGGAYGGSFA